MGIIWDLELLKSCLIAFHRHLVERCIRISAATNRTIYRSINTQGHSSSRDSKRKNAIVHWALLAIQHFSETCFCVSPTRTIVYEICIWIYTYECMYMYMNVFESTLCNWSIRVIITFWFSLSNTVIITKLIYRGCCFFTFYTTELVIKAEGNLTIILISSVWVSNLFLVLLIQFGKITHGVNF